MINYLHVIYVDSGPTRTLKSFRETRAELMKAVVRNEIWCFAVKNTGSDITHLSQHKVTQSADGSERHEDTITALSMGVCVPSSSVARK